MNQIYDVAICGGGLAGLTLARQLRQALPDCSIVLIDPSRQVFSTHRWACVGDSGVFAEPFYAAGTEMIGFGNTITTEMIRLEMEGKLTPELVIVGSQMFNDAYLGHEKSAQVPTVTAPFFFLTRRMQQMFLEWVALSPGNSPSNSWIF